MRKIFGFLRLTFFIRWFVFTLQRLLVTTGKIMVIITAVGGILDLVNLVRASVRWSVVLKGSVTSASSTGCWCRWKECSGRRGNWGRGHKFGWYSSGGYTYPRLLSFQAFQSTLSVGNTHLMVEMEMCVAERVSVSLVLSQGRGSWSDWLPS